MKVLVLSLVIGACLGLYYNVDNTNNLGVKLGEPTRFEISSNRSTGYSWSLVPPNSPYIRVVGGYQGEYLPPKTNMPGAPGR